MSDVAKPDPAAEQVANPGATLVQDETAKVTTDKLADKEAKPAAPAAASSDDKPITEKATEAAAAVKDNVFSMFGGGPKKEKKEEADDVNDRSGSSKAQATGAVSSFGSQKQP
jgi:Ran-binding protein 1